MRVCTAMGLLLSGPHLRAAGSTLVERILIVVCLLCPTQHEPTPGQVCIKLLLKCTHSGFKKHLECSHLMKGVKLPEGPDSGRAAAAVLPELEVNGTLKRRDNTILYKLPTKVVVIPLLGNGQLGTIVATSPFLEDSVTPTL